VTIKTAVSALAPEDFVQPERRLFVDTNVFMDTDPAHEGGLRRLFERCAEAIRAHENPVVVPSKVIDELTKQSAIDISGLSEERAGSIKKAGNALVFLDAAASAGLIRTDLGDVSNPYADDLFVEVFKRAAYRYEMCLLTNDITLRLRIRLLAAETDRRLVAGVLTTDGLIEVDSDQALYERASRKLARMTRHVEEGLGTDKDQNEVAALTPLLADFQQTFRVVPVVAAPGARRATRQPRAASGAARTVPGAFSPSVALKAPDRALEGSAALPSAGDTVQFTSARGDNGTLVLGAMLGEGGEGRVYSVNGAANSVVKIFDAEHRTWHRKEKLTLLLSRGFEREGIGFPTSLITNSDGHFVGYAMPRATGKELQATVMRPARFKKTYPNWTKADLVDVCISFLEKVSYLHSLNILLGDINPKNVMVDANKDVWIIDADSWQLEGYSCPVGTPMFTAPTVTGDYADALRTEEDELFAVATMLFMILITGQFPYARAGADGGDFAALIREGKFAFQFRGASDRDQPEGNWKYMWSHLPFPVKRTFWNTFHRDGQRYAKRPTADEWLRVFREYEQFFGGSDDFDQMSHDVYPTRFKKKDAETPEYECAQCGTSMIGRWQEDKQSYWTPKLCDDCRQNLTRCSDCGKPKSADALRDARCWECNRKQNYAACSNCGKDTPRRYLIDGRCSNCQLVACKDCGMPTPKTELTYGRCASCATKAAQLDPARLCADCRQPFITFDHASWFTSKGLDIPKSHAAIRKTCAPRSVASPRPRPTRPTATSTSPHSTAPRKSLWERFAEWWKS
jgi:serine/threonine protein kinase